MTLPISLYVTGSVMAVNATTPAARMEINVPLTASQLAIASISLATGSVSGDLFVNGTLIANEFKTTVVSASITYRSGSTKQGNSDDDLHEVTGTLQVLGSASVSGPSSFDSLRRLLASIGPDVYFFVSGTQGLSPGDNNGQVAVFGGDVVMSGGLRTAGRLSVDDRGRSALSFGLDNFIFISGTIGLTGAAARRAVFGGDLFVSGGITGSIQKTADGLSYLIAGPGIVITSQSNGQIHITAPVRESADVSASYVIIGPNTGSLPNERTLAQGTGIFITDNGPGQDVTVGINNGVVATLSGSRFTGPLRAADGFSGSLQQLDSGLSYLVGGANIDITTQSNGQILVSSKVDISASFVTLGATGSLPNERVLSASHGVSMTDNGAGQSVNVRLSPPTAVGQLLFAVTTDQFSRVLPITSPNGWLVNDDGYLLVSSSN